MTRKKYGGMRECFTVKLADFYEQTQFFKFMKHLHVNDKKKITLVK